jgi:hypothetical protein
VSLILRTASHKSTLSLYVVICCYCMCIAPNTCLAQPAAHSEIQLSVTPLPTAANPSTGTPQVTWSTGNGSPGIVTVSSSGLKETFFAWSPEGSAAAPWLSADHAYVFRLYSIAPKRRLLARLQVDKTAFFESVAQSQAPNMTSAAENRLLQLLPFGFAALLVLLTTMYIREVRNGV